MVKKTAIASKIKALRKEMKLNQSEFSDLIGVGTRTLAAWETGEVEPPMRRVRSIIEKCHQTAPISVNQFFSEEVQKLYGSDVQPSVSKLNWDQFGNLTEKEKFLMKEIILRDQKIIELQSLLLDQAGIKTSGDLIKKEKPLKESNGL